MDFTKLLALLESRQLYVPRADQFEDPYECRMTRATVDLLREADRIEGQPANTAEQYLEGFEYQRTKFFISCWHMSEHESAAMWKVYLQSPEGIAIRTDHDALAAAAAATPLRVRTAMVRYVDYEKTFVPVASIFTTMLHKRLSFSFESELRLIVWSLEVDNERQIPKDVTGIQIDIDPNQLIKSIHVAPTAPKWFGELVSKVATRYGLSCPIVRSGLYDRPAY